MGILCGIAGLSYPDEGLVKTMCEILIHRGPDEEGYHVDGNVSLGIRRLAIIDRAAGKQPMANEDGSILVIFNGEIYNFKELRTELERLGHTFKTDSDTEVIVHGYEEFREEFFPKLNGMFGFCIYEKYRNRLLLARDPFGEKPLYYNVKDGKLAFASEPKALVVARIVGPSPNLEVVADYLVNGNLPEGRSETFFSEISKIPPGSYGIFEEGRLELKSYYRLAGVKVKPLVRPSAERNLVKEFFRIFKASIRLRLVSEVPVGTSLSGGVDSTSIAAMINELIKERAPEADSVGTLQKCFSAVFDGFELDERRNIELFRESTGVDCFFVSPNSRDLWNELPRLVYHQDEPFETMSVYAQWAVMREAAKSVTVLLDGQGAEPMVGGYYVHYILYLRELLMTGHVLEFLREAMMGSSILLTVAKGYVTSRARGTYARGIVTKDLLQHLKRVPGGLRGSSVSERTTLDMFTRMGNLLRYEDRNSMAFSVESRLPFLDPDLASFTHTLPTNMKARNGYLKFILRRAMSGRVPPQILDARKKVAYDVPEATWLSELNLEIREILTSPSFRSRGFCDPGRAIDLFDRFCRRKLPRDYATFLWRVVVLEMWARIFVDGAYSSIRVSAEGLKS